MVSFEETRGVFLIQAPRRLSTENRDVIYYPNQQTPLWIVFKYKLVEKDIEEKAVEVEVNLIVE